MKFTTEYSKLNWRVFTTIRKADCMYKVGRTYKIQTPFQEFRAQVIGLVWIKKKDITEELAQVDADCSKRKLVEKLEKWYGRKYDDFALITLLRIREIRG